MSDISSHFDKSCMCCRNVSFFFVFFFFFFAVGLTVTL